LATAPFRSAEVATFWRFIVSSLDRLLAVAQSLDDDGLHWRPPAPGANSVAVLVRHTLGNAEENLLMVLCGQSFSRLRDDEFVDHSVSAADLVTAWHEVRPRLEAALSTVEADEMTRLRPHPRRGSVSGRDVLIVVARHAAEHLGQAELTRDLYLWRAGHPASIESRDATL
jgi:uncharacterized damage-inducible protein DinB